MNAFEKSLILVLGAVVKMSDDAAAATNEIDKYMRLLKLHESIQKNKPRLARLTKGLNPGPEVKV